MSLLRTSLTALSIAAALSASTGCAAKNMLGRPVTVIEEHTYNFEGETLSYFEGTSVTDKDSNPNGRPPEYKTRPVALFIEGDGSECQSYSQSMWRNFITKFAGDYVLVRPRMIINVKCGGPWFEHFDFLSRGEEMEVIIKDLTKNHPGQPLILIGHSAGALLAVVYADKHPGAVKAIVDLGGGLDPLDRVIQQSERERGYSVLKLREEEGNIQAKIDDAKANATSDEPMMKRTKKFWGQFLNVDAKTLWLKQQIPVLVVHGVDDEIVPFSLMAKNEREFKRAHKANFTFDFFDGVGHDLFRKDVFEAVNEWLNKHLKDNEVPPPP